MSVFNNKDVNDNYNAAERENEVRTPIKILDPRIRRAQRYEAEDPDLSLGERKESSNSKVLCLTCGRHYASKAGGYFALKWNDYGANNS